jgi:histidinol-phosphate aminotransferase
VSRLAIEAGRAALSDAAHLRRTVELTRAGRLYLAQALGGLGLEVLPSQGNFVAARIDARPGENGAATALADALLRRGLIVRAVASFGLPGFVRMSVGTRSENEKLVEVLRALRAAPVRAARREKR